MVLHDKLIEIYPSLTDADFLPLTGTIELRNDSDGKGDYIAKWEHPTLSRPTENEIKALIGE